MPKYTYKCLECEFIFNLWHSMDESVTDCEECSAEESLSRLPATFTTNTKKDENLKNKPIGSVVKNSIEEYRDDLKEQKKERLRFPND